MDLIVEIPYIQKTGFANKATEKPYIDKMKATYSAYVIPIAKATGVPENIIYAFMYVESRGKANVPMTVGGAQGLMQINSDTVYDTINHELKTNGLNAEEKAIIKKYLPIVNLDGKALNISFAFLKSSLVGALNNPEFNILVGAEYLGRLIDEATVYKITDINNPQFGVTNFTATASANATEKHIRLEQVVVRYNAGYYYSKKYGSKWNSLSKEELYSALPASMQTYVRYVGGINGVMDILSS